MLRARYAECAACQRYSVLVARQAAQGSVRGPINTPAHPSLPSTLKELLFSWVQEDPAVAVLQQHAEKFDIATEDCFKWLQVCQPYHDLFLHVCSMDAYKPFRLPPACPDRCLSIHASSRTRYQ